MTDTPDTHDPHRQLIDTLGELEEDELDALVELAQTKANNGDGLINRRTLLKGGGAAAVLTALGSGQAAADPTGGYGTASDPLEYLYNATYRDYPVIENTGANYTIDLDRSNWYVLTLTDNVTFSFSNVETALGNSVAIRLQQDPTGSRTATWPSNVEWPGGSEPSWSTGSGEVDVVTFLYDPDRDVWYGFPGGLAFA